MIQFNTSKILSEMDELIVHMEDNYNNFHKDNYDLIFGYITRIKGIINDNDISDNTPYENVQRELNKLYNELKTTSLYPAIRKRKSDLKFTPIESIPHDFLFILNLCRISMINITWSDIKTDKNDLSHCEWKGKWFHIKIVGQEDETFDVELWFVIKEKKKDLHAITGISNIESAKIIASQLIANILTDSVDQATLI